MSNLTKLTLTTTTPNQPLTPLARKRIKLLRKLDQQLLAAECASEGKFFKKLLCFGASELTAKAELLAWTLIGKNVPKADINN